jgi:hypothetical protein
MSQIEPNVIPPKTTKGRKIKYPFGEMPVNSSVLIPTAELPATGGNGISSAAGYYGKRNNKQFMTAVEAKGVRVWRVK